MKSHSKFREWANRDDGRHFRVGNQNIGILTTSGALVWMAGFILFLLQEKGLISQGWALATCVVGVGLFGWGLERDSPESGT